MILISLGPVRRRDRNPDIFLNFDLLIRQLNPSDSMPVRSFRSGAGFILLAVARLASLAVLKKFYDRYP